jgi:hypothetical protein
MHFSLHYRFNIRLLIIWGFALSLFAYLSWPMFVPSVAVGIGLGLSLGLLQQRAIQSAPVELVGSRTAMDVRRALSATPPGRWSIRVLWVGFAVLVVVALTTGGVKWPYSLLSGIAAQNLIREALTLGATRRLTESASAGSPSNKRWKGP